MSKCLAICKNGEECKNVSSIGDLCTMHYLVEWRRRGE